MARRPFTVAQSSPPPPPPPPPPPTSDGASLPAPTVEHWSPVLAAINAATRAALPRSPPFDARAPRAFQRYWRRVFADLQRAVDADRAIPTFVSSPRRLHRLSLTLFDRPHATGLGCAGLLPEGEPQVRIECATGRGLTKTDLVRAIGEYLYGNDEHLPVVYVDEDAEDERIAVRGEAEREPRATGAVVYFSEWMWEEERGRRYIYPFRDPPNIWVYCCAPRDYTARVRMIERAQRLERGVGKGGEWMRGNRGTLGDVGGGRRRRLTSKL